MMILIGHKSWNLKIFIVGGESFSTTSRVMLIRGLGLL